MGKLKFLGIGPKIGRIAIPYAVIAIVLSTLYYPVFRFWEDPDKVLRFIGIIVLVSGLIFYGLTIRSLLRGLKETTMVTHGTYYLCQNPLYASFILMLMPGLSLILNSWLVILTSVIAYIPFKVYIKQEYREMEEVFGSAYLDYRNNTPELLPFPVKKWFGR